ncbi:PHP domain-containing protein [Pseudenhygromyxa sp. WMMC2535]|uniref:PHP domain-containing protein n=1 Tax=Pseudenhygromyxa sp. WMMC2535 TaxID=2712867 RepID=UPI001553CF72|nr:PHP domain-containing protein [Pseudenhygromyxa sp. WMMC2535]NVB41356.1 PHP domain-containing protein [Pseudenhygromyxa sp. WMMC2535]
MASLQNTELAAAFAEMADLSQIQAGDRHRISALRRAARILDGLPRPAAEMLRDGSLAKLPGVGAGTLRRIEQLIERGSCDDLDALRGALPAGVREMMKIEGVGPATVRAVYRQLGVDTLDALEHAARSGLIETLPRMGLSHARKILAGLAAYRRRRGKLAHAEALRRGQRLLATLIEQPLVLRAELAGALRRGVDLVEGVDVVVAAVDPAAAVAAIRVLGTLGTLAEGEGNEGEPSPTTRCTLSLGEGHQARLRVVRPPAFAAALVDATGVEAHVQALRERAAARGLGLTDEGLFDGDGRQIDAGADERATYRHLGLAWIPPELREGRGELAAAASGASPRLIRASDLLGDLHMHTRDSDGRGSVEDMLARAAELGLRYVAITDHSRALAVAGGLDEAGLAAQLRRIRARDRQHGEDGPRLLAGIEVDILEDGSLDLDPALLAELDWVVASVHQWTRMSREQMTARIIRAMESGVVDCIGHPTGRRPGKRDGYALDLDALIAAAARLEVALECNGGPQRMDLDDEGCRRCREAGVAVVINTDAHAPEQLGRFEFGLAMARRGGLAVEHVLNAQPWQVIAERRARRLRERGGASTKRLRSAPARGSERTRGGGAKRGLESGPVGFVLEAPDADDDGQAWGEGEA